MSEREIWKYYCEQCGTWINVGDHAVNRHVNPDTGMPGYPVCPDCGMWLDYREWNELPGGEKGDV